MSRQTIFSFGFFLVLGVGIFWAVTQVFRGDDRELSIYEPLDNARTACESRAQRLQQLGIDGEIEYERAAAEIVKTINYLKGVLDDPAPGGETGDRRELQRAIERRLNHAADSCNYFCRWSNQQLWDQGSTSDEIKIDLSDIAQEIMDLLDEGKSPQRENAKKTLDSYRFLSWNDI